MLQVPPSPPKRSSLPVRANAPPCWLQGPESEKRSPSTRSTAEPAPRVGTLLSLSRQIPEHTKETAREVVRALVDDIVLVGERDLERAVSLLLGIEKTVVEGAGAAGLAALLAHPRRFKGAKVGLVLCGGNIDTRLLANVLLRDLARQGRLARLRITLQDRPGALFKVMRLFDEHNVNIIEIYHQRIFTTLPAKGLITDIECEARDAEQVERLVEGLRAKGYTVQLVELG